MLQSCRAPAVTMPFFLLRDICCRIFRDVKWGKVEFRFWDETPQPSVLLPFPHRRCTQCCNLKSRTFPRQHLAQWLCYLRRPTTPLSMPLRQNSQPRLLYNGRRRQTHRHREHKLQIYPSLLEPFAHFKRASTGAVAARKSQDCTCSRSVIEEPSVLLYGTRLLPQPIPTYSM